MLYDVKTPKEYLGLLEDDWRKELILEIREMILSNDSVLKEDIQYKMLCYGEEESILFYLNAQKAYVSLYVGDISKIENSRKLLREFDLGKGCIRVKKGINLQETGLEQFIIDCLKAWRAGKDLGC